MTPACVEHTWEFVDGRRTSKHGAHLQDIITPIHLEITPRFVQIAWESMDGKKNEQLFHLTPYLKILFFNSDRGTHKLLQAYADADM